MSSLPVWRRIGQRGRCPSRCGGKTPHDQNKTPHEEINLTAAVAERPPYHFCTELSCMDKGIFLHSLKGFPVFLNERACTGNAPQHQCRPTLSTALAHSSNAMRYIPAVPDIRMKASAGRSALHEGVDGKPSTTEHMRRQLAVLHFFLHLADACAPCAAAKRPMTNSKRPMSRRHGPHD